MLKIKKKDDKGKLHQLLYHSILFFPGVSENQSISQKMDFKK